MRRRGRSNNNIIIIGAGVLVAILLAAAFYFFYWIRTPQYSLKQIVTAYHKHDVETFMWHVDLDRLYSKAFDDVLIASAKLEGIPLSENILALGVAQAFKEPVISLLKEATLEKVKGDPETNHRKPGEVDETIGKFNEATAFDKSIFKGASVVRKEGTVAIVAVKFYNEEVKKDFTLNIKMVKLEDGKWRIKEITNLIDYIVDVGKAKAGSFFR